MKNSKQNSFHDLELNALSIQSLVQELADLLTDHSKATAVDAQLTVSQVKILSVILAATSPTMGELGEKLDTSLSTVTLLVTRLSRKGLVRRCENRKDKRIVKVRLTLRGRRKIRSVQNSIRRMWEQRLSILPINNQKALIANMESLKCFFHKISLNNRHKKDKSETTSIQLKTDGSINKYDKPSKNKYNRSDKAKRFWLLLLTLSLFTGIFLFGKIDNGNASNEIRPDVSSIFDRSLSLKECTAIALSGNPLIKEQIAALSAARANINIYKSSQLPYINFTYSATHALTPSGAPVVTSVEGVPRQFQSQPLRLSTFKDQIALTQLIYDGGEIAAKINKAKAEHREQGALLEEQKRQISLSIARTFYTALSARELVRINEENFYQANQHLRLAQANFKAGVVAKADVYFAKVPVAKAVLELTRAKNEVLLSFARLLSIMGLDVNQKIEIRDEPGNYNDLPSFQDALSFALNKHPDIIIAQEKINAQKENLKGIKAGKAPLAFFSAAYGWTGYSDDIFPKSPGNSISANVTVPIFDGDLVQSKTKQAESFLSRSMASLKVVEDKITLDVKQAYLSFTSAEESNKNALVAKEYAEENLRLVEGQYKAGVVSIVNLVDARATYLASEVDFMKARYAYELAKIEYLLSAGYSGF